MFAANFIIDHVKQPYVLLKCVSDTLISNIKFCTLILFIHVCLIILKPGPLPQTMCHSMAQFNLI